MLRMPNLSSELENTLLETTLVSTSVSWSSISTNEKAMIPTFNFSLMKYRSILTWFIWSCCTGLWTIFIAALLSKCRFITWFQNRSLSTISSTTTTHKHHETHHIISVGTKFTHHHPGRSARTTICKKEQTDRELLRAPVWYRPKDLGRLSQ